MRRLRLQAPALLAFALAFACACTGGEPSSAPPSSFAPAASRPRVATAAPFPGEGEERLVERIVDGDTVVLLGGEKVRVLGINAAEMKHPDPQVHAVALAARDELSRLAEGKRVRVVVGMPEEPRDQYERLLAYLELPGDGVPDIGERLLRDGLARSYPSAHPRTETYRALARKARADRRGLWREDVARTLGLEPEVTITCSEAGAHAGRLVLVQGKIEPGRRTKGVHVLRLNDASGDLSLVVFPSRYDEIPLELVGQWAGYAVAVTGTISVHEGRPQIKLEDPFQVEPRPSM